MLLPQSKFACDGKNTGYYADEGLNCEVFHYCQDNARHSWICPEGFLFHQVNYFRTTTNIVVNINMKTVKTKTFPSGSFDLHAPQQRQHLHTILPVPFRQRLPLQAHQRRGGIKQTQRDSQVLRQILPRELLRGGYLRSGCGDPSPKKPPTASSAAAAATPSSAPPTPAPPVPLPETCPTQTAQSSIPFSRRSQYTTPAKKATH